MKKIKKVYDKDLIKKVLDVDIYPKGGGKIDLSKFIDTADHIEVSEETYILLSE